MEEEEKNKKKLMGVIKIMGQNLRLQKMVVHCLHEALEERVRQNSLWQVVP